jgi:hypothetical protein
MTAVSNLPEIIWVDCVCSDVYVIFPFVGSQDYWSSELVHRPALVNYNTTFRNWICFRHHMKARRRLLCWVPKKELTSVTGQHTSKSKLYGRRSVGLSVLVSRHHVGPATNFTLPMEFVYRQMRPPLLWSAPPPLTRGRVVFSVRDSSSWSVVSMYMSVSVCTFNI